MPNDGEKCWTVKKEPLSGAGKIIPDTCMLSMTQTLHFKGIL